MKNILIIGGNGALGRSVVSLFKKSQPIWKVLSIDYKPNDQADFNYTIKNNLFSNELQAMSKEIDTKLDCVVNVAGGWQGSSLDDDNIIESIDIMMKQNLYSSVLAAYIAKSHLNKNSLFVLTGAAAVKNQLNPGMLSYHMAKNSVHHLTDLLVETNQLPDKTKVITILPVTIDTEANRLAMKDADYTKWTKPEEIAKLIKGWADTKKYPSENFYKL